MGSPEATGDEAELVLLESRLEDRRSIVDFAQAFSLSCVAFVSGGLAVKLVRDSLRMPKITWVLGIVAVATTTVALVKILRGRRLMAVELRDFQRMMALRTQMGLDHPRLPEA